LINHQAKSLAVKIHLVPQRITTQASVSVQPLLSQPFV